MKQKTCNKLFVQLRSNIDDYRFEQLSRSEQFEELTKHRGDSFVEIPSLKEAVILCKRYITDYNLGGSSWTGGNVYNENYDFIARVSYNGRIWDNEDWKIAQEIKIC